MAYSIVDVKPENAGLLTDIAMQSKAHWGYDNAFMRAARHELAVTPKRLSSQQFVYRCLVENEQHIQGFYSLSMQPDCHDLASYKFDSGNETNTKNRFYAKAAIELEALFILPNAMGKGFGQALFNHAINNPDIKNVATLLIQSDPNALTFYQKLGCKLISEKESGSIKGRFLPLLTYDLS